ncbi:ABC-type uncharacterized transport system, substrate-binding protein [Halodesulfovibrio aestuarii]|uniref:ABC-type uncharacterized transport system, substrate-binding protein n=2 Tax=Halodesulfovibrio aestuarii TaxID=126333 RepID=A0A8G2F9J8_9BACT|nr:ABC-type uncharacterized transport system, substrate-binding protein [Halodesulfovibrio aestuarii]
MYSGLFVTPCLIENDFHCQQENAFFHFFPLLYEANMDPKATKIPIYYRFPPTIYIFTDGYNMKTALFLLLTVCLCCTTFTPRTAHAHPHVFIDSSLTLHFEGNSLNSINVVWTFDDMSSDMFLSDLDTNADGTLTQAEWNKQRPDIQGYLAEHSFFVHVTLNGQKLPLTTVTNFIATFENGTLTYKMDIPLIVSQKATAQKVQIAIFDPSYYSDFYTPLESITVTGKNDLQISIDDAPELAFYQGQIIPTAVTFEF